MTFDANVLLQAASHAAAGQQYPKGALYLVATPIGNLADITLRAIQVLVLADIVACEDTRVTGGLLRHFGLDKKMMAVHQHNEASAAHQVIDALQQGLRVAYVSDAGTPAVSDPGAQLVARVQAAGLRAVPIPGVSSVTTALSVAGDTASTGFHFMGFLPSKGAARATALDEALAWPGSLVLFEAPHRIDDLARDLQTHAAHRQVTLCRELTKQFEEIATLSVPQLPEWIKAQPHRDRGEFVVVVHAAGAVAASDEFSDEVLALLQALSSHLPIKQAAGLVADVTRLPRKALYEKALSWRQADEQS
ncbi:16S rRNA (cytidine(1402)-2'-O)-methyltransferase [Aquabacterium sp.]|uniref:16S rRNA (cytidine(1402)-2'-O)-methyltransferase n=1 Tax=Aquabacterium sp. TaxID=1872578 RepID=UPI00199BEC23|nr:16S rRNA (cytidine(1402)-2'-O)-methyltransferase [Aquabacterium sp.]MBC7701856.1 16S rRNA (cytidine(1402)-2'-O)-methyltransferase [Aquabacterium sp.]